MKVNKILKGIGVYVVFAFPIFLMFLIHPNEHSDPYLDNLRTQYVDYDESKEDKAKLTPLQYNVDRVVFEEALDIFLNPNLTEKEREDIAPIVVDRIRFVQILSEWATTSLKARERLADKIEMAIDIGIYDMAKQSHREKIVEMLRKHYTDDPIAIGD
jgi:hypothetical protein